MHILKRSLAVWCSVPFLLFAAGETNARPAELGALGLTCEYAVDPLGVDTPQPRFGGLLKSDKRACFEMGLLKQADWKGQWIGVTPPSPPAEHLDAAKPGRRNVALFAKPTTSFVSGHETLDAINDGFKPAKSDDKRYGTYDVTSLLPGICF